MFVLGRATPPVKLDPGAKYARNAAFPITINRERYSKHPRVESGHNIKSIMDLLLWNGDVKWVERSNSIWSANKALDKWDRRFSRPVYLNKGGTGLGANWGGGARVFNLADQKRQVRAQLLNYITLFSICFCAFYYFGWRIRKKKWSRGTKAVYLYRLGKSWSGECVRFHLYLFGFIYLWRNEILYGIFH